MLNPIPENALRLFLHSDPAGQIEAPAFARTLVIPHVGAAVQIACRRGDQQHRGLAVHGDIDIIPAHTPSIWQLAEKNTEIILSLAPALVKTVAEQLELDARRVEIRNRFQIRDLHLENIGWALKAEMDSGYPGGRLYSDSLAVAIASRLMTSHSTSSFATETRKAALSGRKLKQVLSFIEDNLSQNLSLFEIAAIAGLSVSHFKMVFRASVGVPVHQYVIRRRVEHAKTLLGESDLAISQIAMEAGFAHQSHLAHHMRRVLGVSPKILRDQLR